MGVNSLPKTVTQQHRGCDLNPDPTAPESSTLTTQYRANPHAAVRKFQLTFSCVRRASLWILGSSSADTTGLGCARDRWSGAGWKTVVFIVLDWLGLGCRIGIQLNGNWILLLHCSWRSTILVRQFVGGMIGHVAIVFCRCLLKSTMNPLQIQALEDCCSTIPEHWIGNSC